MTALERYLELETNLKPKLEVKFRSNLQFEYLIWSQFPILKIKFIKLEIDFFNLKTQIRIKIVQFRIQIGL